MAKAKPRYKARHNIRFNDVQLEGQICMAVSECDLRGNTKQSNGRPLLKKQKTHLKFKFVDKKWLKEKNLHHGWGDGFAVDKKSLSTFWEEVKVEKKDA